MTERLEGIPVRIEWLGVDDQPVLPVNQVILQIGVAGDGRTVDEILMTLGHGTPPMLTVPPSETDGVDYKIRTLARYTMSRRRLGEIIRVLEETARKYDEVKGANE